jgi:hypothetical protein
MGEIPRRFLIMAVAVEELLVADPIRSALRGWDDVIDLAQFPLAEQQVAAGASSVLLV